MFLFTTPTATTTGTNPSSTPVVDAIRQGAEQTGTSFEYLLNTARKESSLDPKAKAGSSSATGLFQFIEQTWLGLVKTEGPKLGLSDLSDSISARSDGGFGVADGATRDSILKLREDPRLASIMAGALTQQNRSSLAAATGREPNSGELYMAHVLGPRGAADVIRAANDNPGRPIALDMPDAAAANRSIFFDRGGRPRSASELYAVLGNTAASSSNDAPKRTVTGVSVAPVQTSGPVLQGLFRTENRTGPISDAVAKLWRVNNTQINPKQAALSYFPRLNEDARDTVAESSAAGPNAEAVALPPAPDVPSSAPSVPLPPPRPKLEASAASQTSNPTRGGRRS